MKRALAFLSVALLALVSCTRSGSSSGGAIAWKNDYAAALAEAKAQNKPVFLDFHADW